MNLRPALILLLLATASQLAAAQNVWRCGADGRQFTDKPCEQGRVLDGLEPRPVQDVAAAQSMARRDQALAAHMVKDREQREAQALKATAGLRTAQAAEPVRTKPAPKAAKRSAKHRPAEDGIWRATVPSSRRATG